MTIWRPINTAPRDGTKVLLATVRPLKARYPIIIGKFVAKFGEWQSEPGAWPARPTHWMPLPEAPAAGEP